MPIYNECIFVVGDILGWCNHNADLLAKLEYPKIYGSSPFIVVDTKPAAQCRPQPVVQIRLPGDNQSPIEDWLVQSWFIKVGSIVDEPDDSGTRDSDNALV
jgi:hypothetical protein